MSHIATYKSTLKGVDQELAKAAFAALIQQNAEKHGWQATEEVYDYMMRNPTACIAGVITPGQSGENRYPYGIGINVSESGELEYVGDLDMQQWRAVQQDLENYYVALGVMGCGEATVEINGEAQNANDVQIDMLIEF